MGKKAADAARLKMEQDFGERYSNQLGTSNTDMSL